MGRFCLSVTINTLELDVLTPVNVCQDFEASDVFQVTQIIQALQSSVNIDDSAYSPESTEEHHSVGNM